MPDVVRDLMTTAMGLTNGSIPMGAVFANGEVYDGMMADPETAIQLSAGTHIPDILSLGAPVWRRLRSTRKRGFRRMRRNSPTCGWMRWMRMTNVIDIRNLGLVGAIELAPRAKVPLAFAYEALVDCFQKGLRIRVTGRARADIREPLNASLRR